MISAGGWTCKTPAFIVHGPNPSTSQRSRTAIVKSRYHVTFQFDSSVLLNRDTLRVQEEDATGALRLEARKQIQTSAA